MQLLQGQIELFRIHKDKHESRKMDSLSRLLYTGHRLYLTVCVWLPITASLFARIYCLLSLGKLLFGNLPPMSPWGRYV